MVETPRLLAKSVMHYSMRLVIPAIEPESTPKAQPGWMPDQVRHDDWFNIAEYRVQPFLQTVEFSHFSAF
jgi:hypothetical protein